MPLKRKAPPPPSFSEDRTRTQESEAEVDPATRVLRQFRMVFNAVKTHFQQMEKAAGIGGAQIWAISVVHDEPGISVGRLAQAMDIHQTTASNLIKGLVRAGYITTSRDVADRRSNRLRLTPEGTKVLGKAPGPFSGVLPAALATLDKESLDRLDEDLGKLLLILSGDERAGRIPLAQL